MRFIETLRRSPKQISAIIAVVAAVITVPAALLAFGPDRPTYTIDNPADHVTFNSITNNPNIGDERNFVGIREVGSSNVWYDDVKVQEGKEYLVRMYVHNNAATSLNASGKGIAKDVTAKFNLPTTTAKSIQVNGFLSASNASPKEVYDHATFTSDKDFNLSYVKDSLKYENNAGDFSLPESIFTSTGAKLGYEKMDGKIPGCFQYSGYVTYKVKPQVAKTTDFTLQKKVSRHGANNWVENYDAKPGETVDFLLAYKNTGEIQHNSVTFRDTLPKGLTYIPGSTTWSNASKQNVKASDNITSAGINVGAYAPGANAYTIFSAKVAAEKDLECGINKLVNKGKVNADDYALEDDASVTVPKECQPVAKYTCDSLAVQKLSRTSFKFATAFTATNATLKNTVYVVRDANGNEVYRGSNDSYQTEKVGTFTVQSYLTFTVNGTDKTVTSENCKKPFEVVPENKDITVCELATKKTITIKASEFDSAKHSTNPADCKETPKVIKVCETATKKIVTINASDFDSKKYSKNLDDCKETPVVPTELPETGAADMIAKFAGLVSLTSATFYYVASRRI